LATSFGIAWRSLLKKHRHQETLQARCHRDRL